MRLRIALPILAAAVAASGIALCARAAGERVLFADLHWRNVGPARSGYISAPAGVPGDPTTYYAGMPEGGVWKTTNGGVTWRPIFDSVGIASVGAVAVAPSDHDVVYVGTGNQSGWSFTTGNGIYKSTDAGKTWTNSGLPASQYIGVDCRRSEEREHRAGRGDRRASRRTRDAELQPHRHADWLNAVSIARPTAAAAGFACFRRMTPPAPPTSGWTTAIRRSSTRRCRAARAPGVCKSIDGGVTWNPVGGKRPAGRRAHRGVHGRLRHAWQAPVRRSRVVADAARPARGARALSIR